MNPAPILMLLLVPGAQVAQTSDLQLQFAESFRSKLGQRLASVSAETSSGEYGWVSREFMPAPATQDGRSHLRRVLHYAATRTSDKLKLTVVADTAQEPTLPGDRIVEQAVWDGSRWATYRPREQKYSISSRRAFNAPLDCVSLLLLNDWPFICGDGGLARSVAFGSIIGFDQDADHTKIRFDLGGERTILELVLQGTDAQKIETLAVESWRAEPDGKRSRMGRVDVEFAAWEHRSGHWLPRRVLRTALADQLARDQGREPTVTVSELEFVASPQSGHTAEFDRHEIPVGTLVFDDCLRIRYREGASEVEIDGAVHQTSAPATVATVSPSWLEANLVSPSVGALEPDSGADRFGASWWRPDTALLALLGALVGLGIGLLRGKWIGRATVEVTSVRQRMIVPLSLMVTGGILGALFAPRALVSSASRSAVPEQSSPAGSPHGWLAGEGRHNFGDVELTQAPTEVRHSFRLTNESPASQEVEILGVQSSCGCAVARPSHSVVKPGETVEIQVALKLSEPGLKAESLSLRLKRGQEESVQKFTIRARGVSRVDWFVTRPQLDLRKHQRQETEVVLLQPAGSSAPAPLLVESSSADVEIQQGVWTRFVPGNAATGVSDRWRCPLSVHREHELRSGAIPSVQLRLSQLNPIVLEVDGLAWP